MPGRLARNRAAGPPKPRPINSHATPEARRLLTYLYGLRGKDAQRAGAHQHHLNNILWAWTSDKPTPGVETFFLSRDKADLLGTDIYPRQDSAAVVYPQRWYATMQQLATDKPLGLSEHSVLPTPAQLAQQLYAWFMSWGEMLFKNNSEAEIKRAYAVPRVLNAGEVAKELN